MCMSSMHSRQLSVTVQCTKLQMLPVQEDWYYCSYDVNCCLIVRHVRASNALNYTYLACCLTIREGVAENVEGSIYVGCTQVQANPKLDY